MESRIHRIFSIACIWSFFWALSALDGFFLVGIGQIFWLGFFGYVPLDLAGTAIFGCALGTVLLFLLWAVSLLADDDIRAVC